MLARTNDFITNTSKAPAFIRNRRVFVGDATINGLNSTLEKFGRAALSHGEASQVYEIDGIPDTKGVHTFSKHRLETYIHCESIDAKTWNTEVHLDSGDHPHSFMHKVLGKIVIVRF